ncbi:short chain dehydrogenase domain-containing protein [Phthorimaea operculella]|nr:short chain dehydrogenase domain-containing protein [Phthorimaea operculella]
MSELIVVTILCGAALICILTRIYQKSTNAVCKSRKKLKGATVVVTGGTAGMGLEVARELAKREAKVIIACPFEQEGIEAQKTIIEDTGNKNVIFKHLDLASLKSVREFAKDILENEDRLDILINNAGVLMPDDIKTADGMSFVMQVNYFAQFLLTILLLPLLKKTGTPTEPSRIINMSSCTHIAGTINLEKINAIGYWYKWRIYANSKLCVAMFTRELSKRLTGSNVVVNSVDPGAVGTRIFDTCGVIIGDFFRILFGTLFKTPWEGAQTALHVALDEKARKISGEYFKNCEVSRATRVVYDEEKCKELWDETVQLLKLDNVLC